jgi:hypothetical protein
LTKIHDYIHDFILTEVAVAILVILLKQIDSRIVQTSGLQKATHGDGLALAERLSWKIVCLANGVN